MVYTPLTIKAIKIAYKAHEGQYDQSGVPYILHPVHLAEQMTDETTTCIALLHDVLEDTALTLPDLEAEFPREITEAVQLLTHAPSDDYLDYVRRLCENPLARKVKIADLAHNSDETRLSSVTPDPMQLKHCSCICKIQKETYERAACKSTCRVQGSSSGTESSKRTEAVHSVS